MNSHDLLDNFVKFHAAYTTRLQAMTAIAFS